MNGLEKNIQRLIKKQRFNLNTVDNTVRWRQGRVNLDYRITWINKEYWDTNVNIMVKGTIEDKKIYAEGDITLTQDENVMKGNELSVDLVKSTSIMKSSQNNKVTVKINNNE